MNKLLSFVSCLLLLVTVSCSNDELKERFVEMEISPELVWDGVRPPGNPEASVQVMECKILDTGEILHISTSKIEGFDYIEGYRYKLKVRIIELENPPADGYSEKYELLEILDKEKC